MKCVYCMCLITFCNLAHLSQVFGAKGVIFAKSKDRHSFEKVPGKGVEEMRLFPVFWQETGSLFKRKRGEETNWFRFTIVCPNLWFDTVPRICHIQQMLWKGKKSQQGKERFSSGARFLQHLRFFPFQR